MYKCISTVSYNIPMYRQHQIMPKKINISINKNNKFVEK